jgi:protein-disulfide isomerase
MNGRLGEIFGWRRATGVLLYVMAGAACDGAIPRAQGTTPPAQAAAQGAALAAVHKPSCAMAGAPPCPGATDRAIEPAAAGEIAAGPVEVGRSPARGPAQAPITLVLFSDFECPFCGRVEATLAALEAAYPGKIRLVWKNFPLDFHVNARAAARAAVAAGEQGKFWEMRSRLLAAQQQLAPGDLEQHAQALGLDLARFRTSASSPATDEVVEADMRQGRSLGVNGTPVLFINRRKLVGAQPLAVIKAAVDEELARPAGGPR